MTTSSLDPYSGTEPALRPIMPGQLIPNSENLFIRLGKTPGDPFTTNASFRTITCSSRGARHALFIRSKRTDNQWCIYSDNAEMVGWLQKTVQGMPNPETAGSGTAVMGAVFLQRGDQCGSWNQPVHPGAKEVSLTWSRLINRS